MAYTLFGLAVRVLSLYFGLLALTSIYQAILPTSPHNKGEIVDPGAELLQKSFKELRSLSPSFDYFVQTVYQVLAQAVLTVVIRYNVNIAIYTGILFAWALLSMVIVVIQVVSWVVWVVLLPFKLLRKIVRFLNGGFSDGGEARPASPAYPKMQDGRRKGFGRSRSWEREHTSYRYW